MACDGTPHILVQKISLRPTAEQAQTLRAWMKAARDTYNKALRLVKDGRAEPTKLLKKLVVTKRNEDNAKAQKMKEAPSDIRSRAILDLVDAFKTAKAGHKAKLRRQKTQKGRWRKRKKQQANNTEKSRRRWRKRVAYHIRYKSKRCTSDSFGFEAKSVQVQNHQLFLFSRLKKFGMQKGIHMAEDPQHSIAKCCRLQYHFGRWYFLLVYESEPPAACISEGRVVALDPGVRTFQSYYSEDEAGEIGTDSKPATRIQQKIAALQERIRTGNDTP